MKGHKFIVKFSYRNLWRAPKRTFIMLLSLMIGTTFIIWNLNFANSGSREVIKEFLLQYAGKFHITHEKFYYDKNNTKLFDIYKTMKDEQILDKSLFAKSSKRVVAPVFVSGASKTLGVLLTGMEVNKELELTTLKKSVKVGHFLSPDGSREIILGKKFARRINAKIGDEVAIIGQAIDGSVANDLMTVVGLLDFGGGDLEESLAFTQFSTAQELMAMPSDTYHERVSFDMEREGLPVIPNLKATLWSDLLPEVGVSVNFIDKFTWLVSFIVVMVISLGLSNTLMITFLEREQEFQCLNIIGAKTSWVTLSLLIEVFLLGSIALFFRVIFGHFATLICYYYPVNLQVFSGGKTIIMGGMEMQPLVRFYPVYAYYWQVPVMIYFFLGSTMIYPLIRVVRRSKNAI